MTENEAVKVIRNNFPKTCKKVDGRLKGGFDDTECDFGKALLLSISALEEIQKYRALGTVEVIEKKLKSELPYMSIAQSKFKAELDAYKALGTVEELRKAMEKQRAKKQRSIDDSESHFRLSKAGFLCCCVTNKDIRYPLISLRDLDYCPRCGQVIDWSEDE